MDLEDWDLNKNYKNFDKEIIFIKSKSDFNKCHKIVLPGVGSFGIAIDFLKKIILPSLKNIF